MKRMPLIPVWIAIIFSASCNSSDKKENDPLADTTQTTTTQTHTETTTTSSIKREELPPVTITHFEAKYPQASDVVWNKYVTTVQPVDLEWDWYDWPVLD